MQKITLEAAEKKKAVHEIQAYFLKEKDEEIGNLAAEFLLDFFLEKVGPLIYNQAIEDAHALLLQQIDEMYGLQKIR